MNVNEVVRSVRYAAMELFRLSEETEAKGMISHARQLEAAASELYGSQASCFVLPEDEAEVRFDSNGNQVTLDPVQDDGLQVIRLLGQSRGYVVDATDPDGGFGDRACPSSHLRPCLTWYGPGERFSTAEAALAACRNDLTLQDVARAYEEHVAGQAESGLPVQSWMEFVRYRIAEHNSAPFKPV